MSTAGAARITTEGGDSYEQRVTPLELFFDLVFVFALTQVTGFFSNHLTWVRMLQGCEGAASELRGSCAVLLGMMQGGGGERRPLITDRRTPNSTRAGGKRGGPPAPAMVYLLTYAYLRMRGSCGSPPRLGRDKPRRAIGELWGRTPGLTLR